MESEIYPFIHEKWEILQKHRKLVLWTFLGTFLICAYFIFRVPKTYEARTTFYFPLQGKDSSLGSLSNSIMGKESQGIFAALLPSSEAHAQDYTRGILQSRAVAGRVIDRFHLLDYYHTKLRSVAEDAELFQRFRDLKDVRNSMVHSQAVFTALPDHLVSEHLERQEFHKVTGLPRRSTLFRYEHAETARGIAVQLSAWLDRCLEGASAHLHDATSVVEFAVDDSESDVDEAG